MNIYIMRHGQAEDFATADALRNLTPYGMNESKGVGQWLAKNNISFDLILVSPYLRAQQTANALISQFNAKCDFMTIDFITPNGNAKNVHDYLDGLINTQPLDNVLLVSHLPLVSYLVAELTVDNAAPLFPTAGLAHIKYDVKSMKGQLVNQISPKDLL